MATLTSNGSFSSLSISGSGTNNGNITFTPPTLPDGATIISTSLTAHLDISMRLGSTKVTINGNTYSSSSSLSINLGTSLISSLSVSAKGSSFLAKGTVSITNIVYTVNYVVKHIITVSTSDGGTISESGEIEIENGNSKTITFSANEGYVIDTVLVDGTDIGKVNSYTFENVTSNHTLSVTFKIISATITVTNNTGIQNIVSYPTEKQLDYNESVDVIVTTPHNSNFKAIENGNNIKFTKLSNQVFTFEEQTITDGFGKGTMYKYGNPTIYTDENGDKMLYMDGNSMLKFDISSYNTNNLTISFDFMITNLETSAHRSLIDIDAFKFSTRAIGNRLAYRILNNNGESIYSYIGSGDKVFNNTWYNLEYCKNGDEHYIFLDGNLIANSTYTNVDKYEFLGIFGYLGNNSALCNGYLKNIIICDSCLHTESYTISNVPLQESDFTGNYSVYKCTDESMFYYPYINNDLLDMVVTYMFNIKNNIFYNKDTSVYIPQNNSGYGLKLLPKISISSFVLSFWYKTNDDITQINEPKVLNIGFNDSTDYIIIRLNKSTTDTDGNTIINNKIHINYHNSNLEEGYAYYKQIDYTIESNNKYFISLEFNDTKLYIYINGVLISEITTFPDKSNLSYIEFVGYNISSYFGNINFIEGLLTNGNNNTVYPINYPIEDIYKYIATLTSEEDINIELIKSLPILSINNITRNKISPISGYDTSVAEFISDTDLTEWEARATVEGQTYGHGIGTLVDSGTTLLANETATVTIDDEELTNGDVEYRISVYGKDANGVWSDE